MDDENHANDDSADMNGQNILSDLSSEKCGQNESHVFSSADADEEFLLSGVLEEFRYEMYIKKCAPELRDALAFLNASAEHDSCYDDCYPDTDEGKSLANAAGELHAYIEQNCGVLRPFFTKYKGKYIFTTCILESVIAKKDFTINMIIDRINDFDNMDLLCNLVSNMNKSEITPYRVVSHAARSKESFCNYLDGLDITNAMKDALLAVYESYNFADLPNATLHADLTAFILSYYEKFKEVFESVRDILEKMRSEVVDGIKRGERCNILVNTYNFRDMIFSGAECKKVTIELLSFASKSVICFGMYDRCLICVSYDSDNMLSNYYNTARIDNKLKCFAYAGAEQFLDVLNEKPCTIQEIVDVTHMNKTCAYRLLKKFLQQNIIIKERDDRYSLNRPQLRDIIKLLEMYGGE